MSFIHDHLFLIFVAVTSNASQGKVIGSIAATKSTRNNMIYRETMIEHGFRSMAKFAAMLGPFCNEIT